MARFRPLLAMSLSTCVAMACCCGTLTNEGQVIGVLKLEAFLDQVLAQISFKLKHYFQQCRSRLVFLSAIPLESRLIVRKFLCIGEQVLNLHSTSIIRELMANQEGVESLGVCLALA